MSPVETAPRLLVVEDDEPLRQFLVEYLHRQGYHVSAVADAAGLWQSLAAESFDLVLLDLGLPDEDGLSVARRLCDRPRPGLLVISGRAEAGDCVEALQQGADDYLTKPVEPRELLARVRSVLRRLPPDEAPAASRTGPTIVPVGRHRLDLATRSLRDPEGREIPLTAMEFDLLLALVRHPDRDLGRDQLMQLAHGREWSPLERGLDIRVTRLRHKLEEDSAAPTLIVTVRGVGYRFVTPPRSPTSDDGGPCLKS